MLPPAGLKDPAGQLARRMKLAQVAVAQQSGDVQRALQLLRELAEAGGEDAKMQVQVLLGDVQYEVSTVGCCCCCCG
jgi:Cdc6-like AAA superfamily ATPase